ncbi:MAG: TatD family hydrolase, partial [Candidatus Levyibacteriota bacterium]
MIDVHCHLNLHKFDTDFDQVIKDAVAAGVTTIINTGTSIPSSRKAVELASKYENLYAIVGIHPHHADKTDKEFEGELQTDWLEKLETLAKKPKVIGIGEVGMDFFRYKSNGIVERPLQEDAFRKQIELSIKLGLPLQIHTRFAWDDTLGILLDYKNKLQDPPGMFHCFSGSIEFTRKVLEAGFYLGFDGNI